MGLDLQDNQQATWWHVDYTGLLSSWKGQHFVLAGIDSYPGYGFAFSACTTSTRTTICELTECLIYSHSIQHIIDSHQRTCSYQKKCGDGPLLMDIASLTMFPTILKQLA